MLEGKVSNSSSLIWILLAILQVVQHQFKTQRLRGIFKPVNRAHHNGWDAYDNVVRNLT